MFLLLFQFNPLALNPELPVQILLILLRIIIIISLIVFINNSKATTIFNSRNTSRAFIITVPLLYVRAQPHHIPASASAYLQICHFIESLLREN